MDIFKQATSLKVKEELQKAGFECEVSYAEDRDFVEGGERVMVLIAIKALYHRKTYVVNGGLSFPVKVMEESRVSEQLRAQIADTLTVEQKYLTQDLVKKLKEGTKTNMSKIYCSDLTCVHCNLLATPHAKNRPRGYIPLGDGSKEFDLGECSKDEIRIEPLSTSSGIVRYNIARCMARSDINQGHVNLLTPVALSEEDAGKEYRKKQVGFKQF